MPTYTFRDQETGQLEDHVLAMSDAPPIGDFWSHEDGRVLQRVYSDPKPEVHVAPDKRYVAWSLDPVVDFNGKLTGNWDPDKVMWDKNPDSPSYGQPLIQSKRDEDEIARGSKGYWRTTKE